MERNKIGIILGWINPWRRYNSTTISQLKSTWRDRFNDYDLLPSSFYSSLPSSSRLLSTAITWTDALSASSTTRICPFRTARTCYFTLIWNVKYHKMKFHLISCHFTQTVWITKFPFTILQIRYWIETYKCRVDALHHSSFHFRLESQWFNCRISARIISLSLSFLMRWGGSTGKEHVVPSPMQLHVLSRSID